MLKNYSTLNILSILSTLCIPLIDQCQDKVSHAARCQNKNIVPTHRSADCDVIPVLSWISVEPSAPAVIDPNGLGYNTSCPLNEDLKTSQPSQNSTTALIYHIPTTYVW